jgi:transposase
MANGSVERFAMGTIRDHFPEENVPEGRPGLKPVVTRQILEAVLWILNTGAQWHTLPQCYPNYKTVHWRFQNWCHSEILGAVMAKGGGAAVGAAKRGKA